MRILEWLNRRSWVLLVLVGVLLVVLIGLADYATGQELSLSILYLLPVGLAAWSGGMGSGAVIAVLSALVWFLADNASGHSYSHPAIPYWNAAVHLGIFLLAAVLLRKLKTTIVEGKALSYADPLTGVANTRHFYELASVEVDRARRYHRPLTVAYLDLDNFKEVNDRFGYSAGDALLRLVAQTIRSNIRTTDLVARVGGDEFVLLLPEAGAESAEAILIKLQKVLLEVTRSKNWPVTCSVGMAVFDTAPPSLEEMIQEASELMHAAKRGGKSTIKRQVVST